MRVTSAMRAYVYKAVLAKVQGALDKAEKARDDAKRIRGKKLADAEALAKKLAAEAQEKFAKLAKSKFGLTLVEQGYDYKGDPINEKNVVVKVHVDDGDFVETLPVRGSLARAIPCKVRDEFDKVCGEPQRIKDAATAAADRLLFELELGKVAKKELDEALKCLEVEV